MLVEGAAVADPDLLVLSGDVGVGEGDAPELVPAHQHVVTALHLTVLTRRRGSPVPGHYKEMILNISLKYHLKVATLRYFIKYPILLNCQDLPIEYFLFLVDKNKKN